MATKRSDKHVLGDHNGRGDLLHWIFPGSLPRIRISALQLDTEAPWRKTPFGYARHGGTQYPQPHEMLPGFSELAALRDPKNPKTQALLCGSTTVDNIFGLGQAQLLRGCKVGPQKAALGHVFEGCQGTSEMENTSGNV